MRKTLVSVVFVCVLAGLVAGGAAAKHKPGKKLAKKPVATAPWDCSVLMPASTFGSLVGGSVTLGAVFESAAHLVSNCNYGGDLVVVNAKTGATDYAHWIAGATQSTKRFASTCTTPPVDDLRDCRLSPLAGVGAQAAEYNRSVVVLTAGRTFVQVYSRDRSLSYGQLEAVARALVAKVK